MFLIYSDGPEGYCYVETKSLDGETNLKLKRAPEKLNLRFKEAGEKGENRYEKEKNFNKMGGQYVGDPPNKELYKYKGELNFENAKKTKQIKLDIDNVCWRGMTLKNTNKVVGVAVYTGYETTIQMNNSAARYKESKLMKSTNYKIIQIFIADIVLSMLAALYNSIWWTSNTSHHYVNYLKPDVEETNAFVLFLMGTGTWILMFTNFVPISLLVTVDLVKVWQGMFIESDSFMVDETYNIASKVNGSNLNEELG